MNHSAAPVGLYSRLAHLAGHTRSVLMHGPWAPAVRVLSFTSRPPSASLWYSNCWCSSELDRTWRALQPTDFTRSSINVNGHHLRRDVLYKCDLRRDIRDSQLTSHFSRTWRTMYNCGRRRLQASYHQKFRVLLIMTFLHVSKAKTTEDRLTQQCRHSFEVLDGVYRD